MYKIVISTNQPKREINLILLLSRLFPDCGISTPVSAIEVNEDMRPGSSSGQFAAKVEGARERDFGRS